MFFGFENILAMRNHLWKTFLTHKAICVCKIALSYLQYACSSYSELSVASVDDGLTITVAKNVAKTIHLFTAKCEQLVSFIVFSINVQKLEHAEARNKAFQI